MALVPGKEEEEESNGTGGPQASDIVRAPFPRDTAIVTRSKGTLCPNDRLARLLCVDEKPAGFVSPFSVGRN